MNKTTVIEDRSTQKTNAVEAISNFPKKSFRYFLAVIPFAIVLLISTSYQQNPDDHNYLEQNFFTPGIADSLRNALYEGDDAYITINENEYSLNREYLRALYFKTGYKPVWIRFDALSDRALSLINIIEHARQYGLEPKNYHFSTITELNRQLSKVGDENINIKAKLDILLTDAALKLMINLHYGYCVLDSEIYKRDYAKEFPQILLNGIEKNNVNNAILSVEPEFLEYKYLRNACNVFINSTLITEESAEIAYPNKDSVLIYSEISKALRNLGYLKFNKNTPQALKEFQKYHGLKADGKPGVNTIEALNRSTLYNYQIIALNLDRLRKKQFSSENMIYVNVPAYSLKVFNKNSIKDTFRVIVGNPSTPTPLFSAYMERVIANPVWYVPRSIAMNEILPKIKADSNYLNRNGFKILDKNNNLISEKELNLNGEEFEYTFRQNRGSDNSLGQVKFIFANPYSVYIHDTPSKSLFAKDLRAFSHGCVRLQNPARLAEYILDLNSDTTNFTRLLDKGQQREFKISLSLPIHITYITCEADEKGRTYFYKDIYGIDKKELEAILPLMGI